MELFVNMFPNWNSLQESKSLQFCLCTWMRPFTKSLMPSAHSFSFKSSVSWNMILIILETLEQLSLRGWGEESDWLIDLHYLRLAPTLTIGEVRPGPGRTQDRYCTTTGSVGWMLPQLWLCLDEMHTITWPDAAWSGFGAVFWCVKNK